LPSPYPLPPPLGQIFRRRSQGHILPGYANLAKATSDLADTATRTCDIAKLRTAFNTAFDAWMGVQHLRFGPSEVGGRGLSIAFWPNPKDSGVSPPPTLPAPHKTLTLIGKTAMPRRR
jgi:predicted lipoprotein